MEKKDLDIIFSSDSTEWETPQDFFDKLNEEFHFTIDVCASPENTKCERYYTKEQDGLRQNWNNEVVWMNPPYGRDINLWMEKAKNTKGIVVGLVPSRTDTKWFHGHVYGVAELRFIEGRLRFSNCKNSAPFPSLIVIYKNDRRNTMV